MTGERHGRDAGARGVVQKRVCGMSPGSSTFDMAGGRSRSCYGRRCNAWDAPIWGVGSSIAIRERTGHLRDHGDDGQPARSCAIERRRGADAAWRTGPEARFVICS